MRHLVRGARLGLAIFALGLAACNDNNPAPPNQQPGQAPQVTIPIPQGAMGLGTAAFGQNPLPIPDGAVVTWVNNDSVTHTVTSDSGGLFASGNIPPGGNFQWRASVTGLVTYHCDIHPAMRGGLQIGIATSPSPSPTPSPSASPPPPGNTYHEVAAILDSSCNSCHSGPNPSKGLDFTTYDHLINNPVETLVVAGHPEQSPIFTHANDNATLTSRQLAVIHDWIAAGALND